MVYVDDDGVMSIRQAEFGWTMCVKMCMCVLRLCDDGGVVARFKFSLVKARL